MIDRSYRWFLLHARGGTQGLDRVVPTHQCAYLACGNQHATPSGTLLIYRHRRYLVSDVRPKTTGVRYTLQSLLLPPIRLYFYTRAPRIEARREPITSGERRREPQPRERKHNRREHMRLVKAMVAFIVRQLYARLDGTFKIWRDLTKKSINAITLSARYLAGSRCRVLVARCEHTAKSHGVKVLMAKCVSEGTHKVWVAWCQRIAATRLSFLTRSRVCGN